MQGDFDKLLAAVVRPPGVGPADESLLILFGGDFGVCDLQVLFDGDIK